MNLTADGQTVMENKYRYDAVDNILGITNAANPTSLTKLNKAKLGGRSSHTYEYDELNRLIHASGKAKRASYDMVISFGRMSEPLTKVQKVDSTTTAKSYNFAYKYEDSNHPTAPTQIGHDHYTYDANGNPTLVTNDSTNTTREMYWDEDNRLMVLSDNGKTSRYTYNAAGERIMKSYGTMEGVYINGAPQGITFHETDNFTLYPASILSVNKNRFTKHYFIGDKRVASRIGTGMFNNVYGCNGSYVTAGQQDYAERMNQIQTQKEAYYKKVGVAPGVPTEKGAYGDPENTGVGYNAVLTELGNHDVPQGWIQTPRPNTTPNTNPGPPVSWNDPSNPDDPQAGYGYIPNDTTKEETFFYHSDHLGSTSYITDDHANITQYDAYLPYGELLVDEHSSSEDLPYKFNGKQFDEETGLYYYGARYMNPVTSLWLGKDPEQETYTNITTYCYTKSNPIKYIDASGKAPIYSNRGVFLGTDDKGLSGNYIIMDKRFFKQGMPHSQAQKHLYSGNISPEVYRKIWNHNAELVKRPDYDGYVTMSEGIKWAKEHPDALKHPTPDNTLYIDASKLDFGSLSTSDFKEEHKVTPQNLFPKDISRFIKSAFFYSERNVVYALGRVNMILLNRNKREVKVVNDNATDYDWNKGGGAWRSFFINFERGRTGLNDSHGFKTFYYGVGHLKE